MYVCVCGLEVTSIKIEVYLRVILFSTASCDLMHSEDFIILYGLSIHSFYLRADGFGKKYILATIASRGSEHFIY